MSHLVRRGIQTALVALVVFPACASGSTPPAKDLLYGSGIEESGMMLPAETPGTPAILFVHGGWGTQQPSLPRVKGEPEALKFQSAGFMVYAVDYPQACRPTAKIRHACLGVEAESVVAAYHWLQGHASSYNGDPGNIEIVGFSAGGAIAERAVNQLETEEPGVLRSVAEFSAPWLNDVTFVRSLEDGESSETGSKPTAYDLQCAHAVPIGGCSKEVEWAESPMFHLAATCAPQWVSWGEVEDAVDPAQSIDYATALEADGCEVLRRPGKKGHVVYIAELESQLFKYWWEH